MVAKSKKIIFGVLAGLFVNSAGAAVTCSSAGLNCSGPATEVVTGVFPADGGYVLLQAQDVPGGTGCTGSSGGANVKLESTHAMFKETYATVLSAIALNADVVLRVQAGAGNECKLKYFRMEAK